MDDVMVIVAVIRARRCGGSAHYRSHAPADCRTDASTMPATRDRAYHGPSAGAEQAAVNCAVGRIVRVCGSGGRQR